MKNILFLLFTIVLFPTLAQTKLELNLIEGESYRQVTDSRAKVTQNIMGQEIVVDMTIYGEMTFVIDRSNGSDYDMSVYYDRLKMVFSTGGSDIISDSASPEDELSKTLKSMIGKPFKIKMSRVGEVLEVSNVDELWESVVNEQGLKGSQKTQILTQLNQNYGAKAIKGNIEIISALYPERRVRKGDSWTKKVNVASEMETESTIIFTYQGNSDRRNLVSGKGIVNSTNKDEYLNKNGIEMKFDLAGEVDYNIKLDERTGWVLEAKINQKINGQANTKPNDQMPDALTIPMKISNTTEIRN